MSFFFFLFFFFFLNGPIIVLIPVAMRLLLYTEKGALGAMTSYPPILVYPHYLSAELPWWGGCLFVISCSPHCVYSSSRSCDFGYVGVHTPSCT